MNVKASGAIDDRDEQPHQEHASDCYHCGLPIPRGSDFRVRILGRLRLLCCKGCEAVANAIVAGGLEDFYRFRTENPPRGEELVPEALRKIEVYDNPQVQQSFVGKGEGSHGHVQTTRRWRFRGRWPLIGHDHAQH